MPRYIEADKLKARMFNYYGCVNADTSKSNYRGETLMNYEVADMIEDCIDNAPTADVVEVKHGYWVDKPTGRYCHYGSWCSVCGNKSGIGGIESNRHKPYCPNCGAKMDGERKE